MFECEICHETFSSRNKLFQHIKTHSVVPNAIKDSTTLFKEEVRLIHEDENCKVICKPQGIPTMGAKHGENLYKHPILLIPDRFKLGGKYRKAVPAHRLDAATGGLIICSKSRDDAVLINQCFRRKLILKRYVSIIPGVLPLAKGMISSEIEGKAALTYFEVIEITNSHQYDKISLLYLWPITGRKHQLRKQLKQLGHPIIADPRFSSSLDWPSDPAFHRLFLWAIEIQFPHLETLKAKYPQLILPSFSDEEEEEEACDEDEGEKEETSPGDHHQIETEGKKAQIVDLPRWLEEKGLLSVFSTVDFSIDLYYQYLLSRYGTVFAVETLTVKIPIPDYYQTFQTLEQQERRT